MPTILQLVPSVGSTTATLDLNTPGIGLFQARFADQESGFPPPPLRRVQAGTLMADGQRIPAAAFDNRTITFTLRLLAGTQQQKQTALGALYRELNKDSAVLRLQWADASASTWYRLLRSPSNPIRRLRPDGKALLVDVECLAEPFGLGLPVTAGAQGSPASPLNANPYFETDTANWTPTGCTRVRSTSQAHEGAASMLVTPDGVTSGPHVDSEQVGDGSPLAGRGVRASGWLRSPSTPTVGVRVNLYDAAHAYQTTLVTPAAIAANTWTFYDTGELYGISGTAYVQALVAYSGTPTAGQTLFADELKVWVTGSYQVTNDPAAATWGSYLDVAGVTGDVETPAKIAMSANSNNMAPILSVRRHGTVTDIAPVVQAEAATQGTDTTTGADANMSGGSRSRTSFATVASMATRLTVDLPYSGGLPRTAARGTYHLFAMVASSAASNTFKIQMQIVSAFGGAIPMATGVPVTYVATDTSRRLVDLGLFAVPVGPDPIFDGYGAEAAVGSAQVLIQAQRVSGSGSLDWDFVAAMPADEEYMETATTYLDIVADGMNDVVYTPGGFGEVTANAVPAIPRVSKIPMLSPNQTNRIYFLRPDGIGTGAVRGPDTKTRTAAVTIAYNPSYLTWVP